MRFCGWLRLRVALRMACYSDLADDLLTLLMILIMAWLLEIQGRGRVRLPNSPVGRGTHQVKVPAAILGMDNAAGLDGTAIAESDIFVCIIARAGIRTRGFGEDEIETLTFSYLSQGWLDGPVGAGC